ncbi:hypothetical protein ABGB17_26230, partial [Sphaerisporangium sp. B11E5]
MIYLSAILVVLAFGLLVAGVVTGTAVLVMWSIVVSVLSAVFLMIGALLRRHQLFPSGGTKAAMVPPPMPPVGAGVGGGAMARPGAMAAAAAPARGASPTLTRPVHPPAAAHPATARPTAAQGPSRAFTAPGGPRPPAGARPSPDTIVLVIPGRRRFHLPGCRQLAGREHEELTYEEAREEGFSACTTCLPTTTAADPAARPPLSGSAARLTPEQPARPSHDPATRAEPSPRPLAPAFPPGPPTP